MAKQTKYHIGIEVDKLTNSIVNTVSGDSFLTDVQLVTMADLKSITKKNGWLFN
jgi:SHS2 domain-containing protein